LGGDDIGLGRRSFIGVAVTRQVNAVKQILYQDVLSVAGSENYSISASTNRLVWGQECKKY
jgi:hypothetical protein